MKREIPNPNRHAILLIKKDGEDALYDGLPLPQVLKFELFSKYALNILLERIVNLDENIVRTLYPKLNEADLEYGDWWKPLVIDYLVGQDVTCFLLESENDACKKAQSLKRDIRTTTNNSKNEDWTQRNIYNSRVHVVDEEDYLKSYSVLFEDISE